MALGNRPINVRRPANCTPIGTCENHVSGRGLCRMTHDSGHTPAHTRDLSGVDLGLIHYNEIPSQHLCSIYWDYSIY
jgi:hypothetical protein